jgi:dTMP kinase
MYKNTYPGLFITIEGIDGAGQTTQTGLLAEHLKNSGYKIYATKEPTFSLIGGLIRGRLTGDWNTNSNCLQLLFAADRAHHLQKEIIPVLKEGRIVISDRYLLSSLAYGPLESDERWLFQINDQFLFPDINFILEVDAVRALKRIIAQRFTIELYEDKRKLEKVLKNYKYLAKKFSNDEEFADSIYLINGNRPQDEVLDNLVKIVEKKIDEREIHLEYRLAKFDKSCQKI